MNGSLLDNIIFSYEFDWCRIIVLLDDVTIGYYTSRNNTFCISYGALSEVAQMAEIEKFTLDFIEFYKIGVAYKEPDDLDYFMRTDTLEEFRNIRRAIWIGTTVLRNV